MKALAAIFSIGMFTFATQTQASLTYQYSGNPFSDGSGSLKAFVTL